MSYTYDIYDPHGCYHDAETEAIEQDKRVEHYENEFHECGFWCPYWMREGE